MRVSGIEKVQYYNGALYVTGPYRTAWQSPYVHEVVTSVWQGTITTAESGSKHWFFNVHGK